MVEKIYLETQPKPTPIITEPFLIRELDDFMTDIENKVEAMYKTIILLAKKKNVIHFSSLVKGLKKLEAIRTFLLILFLATREKIKLWQDEEFGEMYISLD